jgi:alkanesulfonate monooxygenase
MKRKMHLSLSIAHLGYHPAAWRMQGVPADGTMNFQHYVNCCRIAAAGKFDFIFLADVAAVREFGDPRVRRDREQQHAKHEPFTLIGALASVVPEIGFIATGSTSFHHPYNFARRLSTLDHISQGRVGWNLVTSWSRDEAANFGLPAPLDSDARHARAREFADIVTRLFDTWEDEAFVRDKASGVYFDRDKLHFLDHDGKHFKVKGPLDTSRPPQGIPPIATAGASANAQELAAAVADIVYAGQPSLASARAYYASVKNRLPRYGRAPDSLLIMPGVMPFVGRTLQEAQDKLDRLHELLDPAVGIGQLIIAGFPDFTGCPIDGPIPEDAAPSFEIKGAQPDSFATTLLARARRDGLTIRQLIQLVCGGDLWQLGVVGTPAMIVDVLEEWFTTGAADGFNVQAPYLPGSATDFVELIMPELRRRGLFRTEYEGRTLRDRLGLARPPNVFAAGPREMRSTAR